MLTNNEDWRLFGDGFTVQSITTPIHPVSDYYTTTQERKYCKEHAILK